MNVSPNYSISIMSNEQDIPEATSADAQETDGDRHDPRLLAENDKVRIRLAEAPLLFSKPVSTSLSHSLSLRSALQRDYIECSRAYMEMAIGNAPWPIGVTNAGIHARPARESIFSKQIAHVLNDETQRKYIQVGLKNLIHSTYQNLTE